MYDWPLSTAEKKEPSSKLIGKRVCIARFLSFFSMCRCTSSSIVGLTSRNLNGSLSIRGLSSAQAVPSQASSTATTKAGGGRKQKSAGAFAIVATECTAWAADGYTKDRPLKSTVVG